MERKFFDINDRSFWYDVFFNILKDNLYIRVSDERIKIENMDNVVEMLLDELDDVVNY